MVLWHAVPLWAARLLRHILTVRSALATGQAWPDPYVATVAATMRVPLQRDACPITTRQGRRRGEAQLRAGAKKPRAGEGGTPEGRGPGWPEFTSPAVNHADAVTRCPTGMIDITNGHDYSS